MAHSAEEQTRAAYDMVADSYADYFTSTEPEQAIELAMVDHFTAVLPEPRRVLDAGCGAGRMMPYLAARGCLVEGIDLSPEMIRRTKQDHPEFTSRIGSLTALDYPAGSFDGVFSWYSTIHNPDADLDMIVRGLAQLLRPAGFLLVAFQIGEGRHEVGAGYRALGHDVEMYRYGRTMDRMASAVDRARLQVTCRLQRAAMGREKCGQGVLIAQHSSATQYSCAPIGR